jgi:hypothetical protein
MPIRRERLQEPAEQEPQMLRWIAGASLIAASLAASAANDGPVELRTKALASAASTSVLAGPMAGTTHRLDAPFMQSTHDPLPAILQEEELAQRTALGSRCDASATSLCYDAADGRLVYRGARDYMPKVVGLSPESVTIRRNRLVLKYSFR